jgi:release factor glutamine methyltransferase
MKIFDALKIARGELSRSGVNTAFLDSLLLMSHTTSSCKEKIIFNPELKLTKCEADIFFSLVARRSKREPISHIIQNREFFGVDFFVNKFVLDPRPDSETLIELALKLFDGKKELSILDIGTGSACLIIALLQQFQNAKAVAVDIDENALLVAKKNAATHKLSDKIEFICCDLFAKIDGKFDLIISNPPYIKSSEIKKLENEVRLYEPILALDGGDDGLDFYRKIANNSADFLKEGGVVILEAGYDQKLTVEEIFLENNFQLKSYKKDLGGIDRALCFIPNLIQSTDF